MTKHRQGDRARRGETASSPPPRTFRGILPSTQSSSRSTGVVLGIKGASPWPFLPTGHCRSSTSTICRPQARCPEGMRRRPLQGALQKAGQKALPPWLVSPGEFLALSASRILLPRTRLPPAVPKQLKPTHSICFRGQLTLLSPVMVPTKQAGQRSRAPTRRRKSRSEGLSRSALDSWYSAPQISRAFRVGSPSCTPWRRRKEKGQWVPKFHVGRLGWRDFHGQTSGKRLAWKQLV